MTIPLDASYTAGLFTDFAIYYTVDPLANAPTVGALIAHPVAFLPFGFVVPQDFPRSETVRFWIAGHNASHERTALDSTGFLKIADYCQAPIISGLAADLVNQHRAHVVWSINYGLPSRLEYGTSTPPSTVSPEVTVSTNSPAGEYDYGLSLSDLQPNTLYYMRAVATDVNGNQITTPVRTFTTLSATSTPTDQSTQTDIKIISEIVTTRISATSTALSWRTNIPGDSEVEYGLIESFGLTVKDPIATTTHRVTLTGLLPQRLYYYRVKSTAGEVKTVSERRRFIATAFSFSSEQYAPQIIPSFQVWRNGDEDPAVADIQIKLQSLGYFPKGRVASGYFGTITESALKKYQRSVGLPQTGIFDKATYGQFYTTGAISSTLVPPITVGDQSNAIYRAQLLLSKLKFYPPDVSPNGFFGPITAQALRDFQKFYGLAQTGKFDTTTSAILNNMLQTNQ
jgi:peptidoglycan hydrolase-like protein with peptidoglycan-binding domain